MILLIIVDGVGIGTRGPHNPLDGSESRYFSHFAGENCELPFGGSMAPTEVTLGVDGLPQSATGQATIVTGQNAAAFLGRHLSAFPGGSLRPLLREHSIFRAVLDAGGSVAHANIAPASVGRRRVRTVSAMTVAAEEAGMPARTLEDVRSGTALHHDFTNELLAGYGCDVPRRDEAEAGALLVRIAREVDLCGFEYFLTDAAGHAQDEEAARRNLARLDKFLDAILDEVNPGVESVVVTSDHGNLEDLSTPSHTLNRVATMAWGLGARELISTVESLTDIAPGVVHLATQKPLTRTNRK